MNRYNELRKVFTQVLVAAAIGSLLIGFSLGFGVRSAIGAELTGEQAESIYAVAYGQFHGPREWLDQRPNIHVITHGELCAFAEEAPDCRILGAYVPGEVYIDGGIDFSTVYGASILFHEFIHHFQWLKDGSAEFDAAIANGDRFSACLVNLRREQQAYAMQAILLEKAGESGRAMNVRTNLVQMQCRPY